VNVALTPVGSIISMSPIVGIRVVPFAIF
jgi:hypothetical protein